MKNYESINRIPDLVVVGGDKGWFECQKEGDVFSCEIGTVSFRKQGNALAVLLNGAEGVSRIKLRFRGDYSGIEKVYADMWTVGLGYLGWYPVDESKAMPWYFCAIEDGVTDGYGVKTGCNSIACFQLDSCGLCLWLDVRNGGDGLYRKDELVCAEIVERSGEKGESPFDACRSFCKIMCEKPALLNRPVFGLNNWYYAYGNLTRESILKDAELCGELGSDANFKPYMLVDDGWQLLHDKDYNGAPFVSSEKIGDMKTLAEEIEKLGALPGVWIRPLLTKDELPEECYSPDHKQIGGGKVLDASNAQSLEYISEMVKKIINDGYKMIKYDFTAPDYMGGNCLHHYQAQAGWHFTDRSKTNAEIIKNLYRTIKDAAGDAVVMGCNTYNHLSAGINNIQRSGSDTSGMIWDFTRQEGINALSMRLHQNGVFFATDPDCPAFTPAVSHEYNMRFLELACDCDVSIFASIVPGILNPEYKTRARAAFKRASERHSTQPVDWTTHINPTKFITDGNEKVYNWYDLSDGVNLFGETGFYMNRKK